MKSLTVEVAMVAVAAEAARTRREEGDARRDPPQPKRLDLDEEEVTRLRGDEGRAVADADDLNVRARARLLMDAAARIIWLVMCALPPITSREQNDPRKKKFAQNTMDFVAVSSSLDARSVASSCQQAKG
jgi:hypothetical protein